MTKTAKSPQKNRVTRTRQSPQTGHVRVLRVLRLTRARARMHEQLKTKQSRADIFNADIAEIAESQYLRALSHPRKSDTQERTRT